MTDKQHKECYGTMFPDALHYQSDRMMSGKVFAFEMDTAGGLYRSDRKMKVNMKEWDDCLECPEFDSCHKLCMASMVLESAIANR
ncbi:MAG TPA: hypothetical protein PKN33_19880 [Phycisphaerae bacterium]|nr:hypothetical protein [Phycisphaerae bacterium]